MLGCFSPFIGGTLARPHDRFPIFHSAFWEKYPYFLPCIVSATYSALALLLAFCFLKEVTHSLVNLCHLIANIESDAPKNSSCSRQ
jgi:hypothetical protein